MTGGTKLDADKPDLSLIPLSAKVSMARALMVGVNKYGRYNFIKGFAASRLVAAAERHLGAWFHQREEDDPADGQPHLGAALACISMLIEIQQRGTMTDDRPDPIHTPRVPSSSKAEASPAPLSGDSEHNAGGIPVTESIRQG